MNPIFLLSAFVGILTLVGGCSSPQREISAQSSEDQWQTSGSLDSPAAAERHGCCSNRGGACGCANGRVQCCDGGEATRCGCR